MIRVSAPLARKLKRERSPTFPLTRHFSDEKAHRHFLTIIGHTRSYRCCKFFILHVKIVLPGPTIDLG